MKINSKFLSLPPHISTAWKNITSIQVIVDNGINVLAILLNDSNVIKIPGLSQEVIENIFASHSEYLEDSSNESGETDLESMAANLGIPLQFGMDGFQGFGAMQHNPEQADAPDIPAEVLSKITQILSDAKISVEAVIQKEPEAGEDHVPLIILTDRVVEKSLDSAVAQIQQMDSIAGEITRIRVESLG